MSVALSVPFDEFQGFGKIPRLRRSCLITEKIDGTNAAVTIERIGSLDSELPRDDSVTIYTRDTGGDLFAVRAQSRKRFVTPGADNYGFARWVRDNADELVMLGEGRHYGEWWGQGIQRTYGLDAKRFSLFNAARWGDETGNERPACCGVVPILYSGIFTTDAVDDAVDRLRSGGSLAAPGWDRPEGVIVYQVAAGTYGKVLLENDDIPKSVADELDRA